MHVNYNIHPSEPKSAARVDDEVREVSAPHFLLLNSTPAAQEFQRERAVPHHKYVAWATSDLLYVSFTSLYIPEQG